MQKKTTNKSAYYLINLLGFKSFMLANDAGVINKESWSRTMSFLFHRLWPKHLLALLNICHRTLQSLFICFVLNSGYIFQQNSGGGGGYGSSSGYGYSEDEYGYSRRFRWEPWLETRGSEMSQCHFHLQCRQKQTTTDCGLYRPSPVENCSAWKIDDGKKWL